MGDPAANFLGAVTIDGHVRQAHPDYVALLIVATGLEPGSGTTHSEALLVAAEREATQLIDSGAAHDLPEVQLWREAYKGFGVKPRDARSSIEALLRRVDTGLPRIDRLTDTYNAISVRHLVPIGGEDLRGYQGHARLVVADGSESFDTVVDGEETVVSPTPGEIVWRDDAGITCRRWNWRQCRRTRLGDSTTEALFILDSLGSNSTHRARTAGEDLMQALQVDSPAAVFQTRLLGPEEEQ